MTDTKIMTDINRIHARMTGHDGFSGHESRNRMMIFQRGAIRHGNPSWRSETFETSQCDRMGVLGKPMTHDGLTCHGVAPGMTGMTDYLMTDHGMAHARMTGHDGFSGHETNKSSMTHDRFSLIVRLNARTHTYVLSDLTQKNLSSVMRHAGTAARR